MRGTTNRVSGRLSDTPEGRALDDLQPQTYPVIAPPRHPRGRVVSVWWPRRSPRVLPNLFLTLARANPLAPPPDLGPARENPGPRGPMSPEDRVDIYRAQRGGAHWLSHRQRRRYDKKLNRLMGERRRDHATQALRDRGRS